MAAIRIESFAFSDQRFEILAKAAGLSDADHARGKMARLWSQCTLEETYSLTHADIICVFGQCGPDALFESRLGELDESTGKIRIKGTGGRIEWIKTCRDNGKYGGMGGRPKKKNNPTGLRKKNPTGLSHKNPSGLDLETPTTTATTTATSIVKRETPLPPSLENPEFRAAWEAWERHRREKGQKLTPSTIKLQLADMEGLGLNRAIAAIKNSIKGGYTGLFEPNQSGTKTNVNRTIHRCT